MQKYRGGEPITYKLYSTLNNSILVYCANEKTPETLTICVIYFIIF